MLSLSVWYSLQWKLLRLLVLYLAFVPGHRSSLARLGCRTAAHCTLKCSCDGTSIRASHILYELPSWISSFRRCPFPRYYISCSFAKLPWKSFRMSAFIDFRFKVDYFRYRQQSLRRLWPRLYTFGYITIGYGRASFYFCRFRLQQCLLEW